MITHLQLFPGVCGFYTIKKKHSQVDTLPMEPALPMEAEDSHDGKQVSEKNPPEELAKLDAHPNRIFLLVGKP